MRLLVGLQIGQLEDLHKCFATELQSWRLANQHAEKLARHFPADRYLRVRYEDIATHPNEALIRMGNFIGLDTSPIIQSIADGQAFEAHHNVGGNRLRLDGQVVFKPSKGIRQARLSLFNESVFRIVSGRMNAAYGY